MKTFWEKEVLLMRGTFTIPPLKEGHRYRLVVGGLSHMNNGDGVRVYVNGKQVLEREREFKKREGGHPVCLLHRPGASGRVPKRQGDHCRHGFPPHPFAEQEQGQLHGHLVRGDEDAAAGSGRGEEGGRGQAAASAEWQALQDPGRNSEDPEAGKFKWDGKFVANPAVLGTWTTVALVPTIEAFDPAKPVDAGRAPFKEITFKDGGKTSEPHDASGPATR